MVIAINHKFTSAKADSADASLIRPSNWNDTHNITLAASRIIGRSNSGAGVAEELTLGTGLQMSGTALQVNTANVVSLNNITTGLGAPAWTAVSVAAAPAKARAVDADLLAIADSAASNALKSFSFANLVSSLFNTSRVIPTANFSTSLRIRDTTDPTKQAGFDASAITAAATRNMKIPDRDITLGGGVNVGAKATPASTAVTITGIPAGVAKFTVHLLDVVFNTSSQASIRLGTSSGLVTTGYVCFVAVLQGTTGTSSSVFTSFVALNNGTSSVQYTGSITFTRQPGSNEWVYNGQLAIGNADRSGYIQGKVSLPAELDRIQVSSVGGTATMSGSSIWVDWEFAAS